jgi:hypothetical protein
MNSVPEKHESVEKDIFDTSEIDEKNKEIVKLRLELLIASEKEDKLKSKLEIQNKEFVQFGIQLANN